MKTFDVGMHSKARPHATPRVTRRAGTWRTLYVAGSVGALIPALMTIVGVGTYIVAPPPTGPVTEWFALFQRSWLLGMLELDLPILVSYVALIPCILALYIALRRSGTGLVLLGTACALVAIAVYCASSRVFEMLALSQQYAAATTDKQRALLEAAGQSMLTTYLGVFGGPAQLGGSIYQGTAFNISFVLLSIAGMLLSISMLHHHAFGSVTGYAGIAGNGLALGLFFPAVGVYLSLAALPIVLIWYLLIARGLLRLGRATRTFA